MLGTLPVIGTLIALDTLTVFGTLTALCTLIIVRSMFSLLYTTAGNFVGVPLRVSGVGRRVPPQYCIILYMCSAIYGANSSY